MNFTSKVFFWNWVKEVTVLRGQSSIGSAKWCTWVFSVKSWWLNIWPFQLSEQLTESLAQDSAIKKHNYLQQTFVLCFISCCCFTVKVSCRFTSELWMWGFMASALTPTKDQHKHRCETRPQTEVIQVESPKVPKSSETVTVWLWLVPHKQLGFAQSSSSIKAFQCNWLVWNN